ncbi:prorelaxin 1 precursor [Mus musculus]|uniref:Relaxin 1 n=2 Tax=Mus musculus TaxID=10090 RepID=A2RTV8_MOUSE|nr:prorelaxin 1 precursor [Mus musculus]AAI32655.1 Relaxin 1 [Mus musculus]AAI32657.1 Relaxin 1 [Mus musculus]EDL41676.1 relaxin 1 [Mus musculus]|eukprot:NP_035402.2 prorelaxin 1 precursor [Mus musculus]
MSSRFLLQLLGFWLLLSQPCRTRVSEEWMDGFIRMCGREYARELIKICGASVGRLALSQEEPALLARQATEVVPSFINKDAEPFDTTLKCLPNLSEELKAVLSEAQASLPELQHAPVLSDSVVSLEGFKKTLHDKLGEAEDGSPPGLKYLQSDTHSRKKRESGGLMSQQCCHVGCSRRSIAKLYC